MCKLIGTCEGVNTAHSITPFVDYLYSPKCMLFIQTVDSLTRVGKWQKKGAKNVLH